MIIAQNAPETQSETAAAQNGKTHSQAYQNGQNGSDPAGAKEKPNKDKASPERHKQHDAMAPKPIEDQVVEELNRKHAVVHTDQFYILTEKPHALIEKATDFVLESKQSFINTYENQTVKDSKGNQKNKAKIWLAHEDRRQYQGITFDPTTTGHSRGYYNIWKGFAVEPRKGNCDLYKDLVANVICAGNKEYFRYVWKWMSRLAQKPDEIATGLVLMSKQGTGKGKFSKTLGRIFGPHFLHLDSLERLLGNFNFHMKNAVLVFGDEAIWGGNKKDVGKIKAMVTEELAMIEPKGKDSIAVRNFRHFILSSNEEWPVHLDPDDRRFLVLKVSEKRKEDFAYFEAIDKEMENGGLEALLYDLLHEDISDFNPRKLPQNIEAFDIKMKSATSAEEYIHTALREGCFDIGNATPSMSWGEKIRVGSVYSDYCTWCERSKINNAKVVKNTVFGAVLHTLVPSIEKRRPAAKPGEPRPEFYFLPSLEKAREDFQKAFKVGANIWD